MQHALPKFLAIAIATTSATMTLAAPITVSGLGVAGWESGDTRPAGGGIATPDQIAAQIKFLGEGQVVAAAYGPAPDASPTGSLNGAGYVRLDGTDQNSGKSDIGYLDINGMGAASTLLSDDFFATYRAYTDPNNTVRTVGFGIAVSNGLSNCGLSGIQACYYTFSHIDPDTGSNPNAWLTETVTASSGLFRLFGGGSVADGGAPGGSISKTLADWATDPSWGFLFSDNSAYDILRVNFNLGSDQRAALVYVDWVQTNLLNGGDLIDFVAATAVPEPGSLALAGLALAGLYGARRRKPA
jgi:hypothetical protein